MRRPKNLPAIGITLALIACLAAFYATRGTNVSRNTGPAKEDWVWRLNQLMQTARHMAEVADTTEEQDLAREALRLADHDLDQAYATALREATAPAAKTGPLKELISRIAELKGRLATGQQRIEQLTKEAVSSDTAADQLELAKAQLALDEDELEDARQDLVRQGGDQRAELVRAQQEHQNAQRGLPPASNPAARNPSTLKDQLMLWLALGDRNTNLNAAREQASAKSKKLLGEHDALENLLENPGGAPSGPELQETAAKVSWLHGLSDSRKTLKELDGRIEDTRHLADVYGRWISVVEARRRDVLHQMLRLFSWILVVALGVVLVGRALRGAFRGHDRRRTHQARLVSQLAVQLVGLGIILLIIFGPPTQISTMIGLATAGLTVVLKDFIVAFFGWFVLMGRNGVRIGDWVEINGVGGEVIEIGLLKTVLLEMGNWSNTGHPTGRRVGIMNSYAIEGRYFNFSTAGQWLWDELQVTVPREGDPYGIAEQIRQTVERETESDATEAEQDWERVTKQYGTRSFSARPAVDLRPASSGLDVVVRYITRAPLRYQVKSRLFQAIVALLHKPVGETQAAEKHS